jgi:5-methyltetrahydrofolate--homocysteine methyltransferase
MGGRSGLLESLLKERILLLDGATGTALASMRLQASDYGGEALIGCHEALVLHKPEAVLALHRLYLGAGADIVETDTFGGTPVVLGEYGLQERAKEINRQAAALARQACAEAEANDPSRPRFVAGSMGPTTKSLTLTGGITFDEMVRAYAVQAEGLAEGGADVFLIETIQDALNMKAALIACREAAPSLPVAVSATMQPSGTTLGGQTIEALAVTAAPWNPLWIGLNCATGPKAMAEDLRALAALTSAFVSVVPNAGLPDAKGRYLETPEQMAAVLDRYASRGLVNVIGGCCGTTAEHIRQLRAVASRNRPRVAPPYDKARIAGGEARELAQERPPLLIGERTNALGSRTFKKLVQERRFAEAAEIGRRQAKNGAQVLDICLADARGDEKASMAEVVVALRRAVRLPFMVDTTDPEVMETALKLIPGRAILNSVNLEDGGARLERTASIAKRYGAALVAGCIDGHPTDGMARTCARKVEVAGKLLERLESLGFSRREILLDALVFPAATGDPKFRGSAKETIEGVRAIKTTFPGSLTVLGISNVSFGLPTAAREVLNAVFLHHCVQAGLDAAIVNTEQLVRYPSLKPDEAALAEDLLFTGSASSIEAFAALYRGRPAREAAIRIMKDLPPRERVKRMVVEGERSGLKEALDELLLGAGPLAIISGPLMEGMDEVGRLFARGELIVAEVLVSAEVMQAAVDHLRPRLKGGEARRGSITLATVRGDVHDIGKNLVGMIFSSNGYEVVDLGVQVTSDKLIAALRARKTDLVGLSGLLVRSANQMAETAKDMAAQDISVPVLVGGAALSASFTRERIAPVYRGAVAYAPDAMAGLSEARRILEGGSRSSKAEGASVQSEKVEPPSIPQPPDPPLDPAVLPHPPWLGRKVLGALDLDEVFRYLNAQMLLGKHLGLKGSVARLLEQKDAKAGKIAALVEELKDAAVARQWLRPSAVFGFFRAYGKDESVVILDPRGSPIAELPFPRMKRAPCRSAAHWVHPDAEANDSVALFCVTAGAQAQEKAMELRAEGSLLQSYALQALALETAEAAAEWLHKRIRELWGIPDPKELAIQDIFHAKYRGIRLSFGYPACPDMEPQRDLFSLLNPEEIGVHLTESFMMDPEASVSAVVFHHPEARYLS